MGQSKGWTVKAWKEIFSHKRKMNANERASCSVQPNKREGKQRGNAMYARRVEYGERSGEWSCGGDVSCRW